MAKATISSSVILTLTQDETETLLLVCRHVGGDPEGSRRHIDKIMKALAEVVTYNNADFRSGSIYLK